MYFAQLQLLTPGYARKLLTHDWVLLQDECSPGFIRCVTRQEVLIQCISSRLEAHKRRRAPGRPAGGWQGKAASAQRWWRQLSRVSADPHQVRGLILVITRHLSE